MNRSTQRIVGGLGGLVALLLAVPLLLRVTADDPIAAAKSQADSAGASFLGFDLSDGPFGGHATVRFQGPGKASEPIEVKMARPLWSRNWRRISGGPPGPANGPG